MRRCEPVGARATSEFRVRRATSADPYRSRNTAPREKKKSSVRKGIRRPFAQTTRPLENSPLTRLWRVRRCEEWFYGILSYHQVREGDVNYSIPWSPVDIEVTVLAIVALACTFFTLLPSSAFFYLFTKLLTDARVRRCDPVTRGRVHGEGG